MEFAPSKNLSQKKQDSITPKNLQSFLYGKMPPQNIELERAVLGAIMLEKGAFDVAADIINANCFYDDRHQMIYQTFETLQQTIKPIDILTVAEQLKVEGKFEQIGGSHYLTELTQDIVSTSHLEAHAHVVLEKFIQRELMTASSQIISRSSEDIDNIAGLMDFAEDKIFNITQSYVKGDYKKMGKILIDVSQRIEQLQKSPEKISGVYTDFKTLDSITHGWQATDLIILAARPSVGKTAFALNLALKAAQHKTKPTPVGLFSLEMSSEQLVQRLLANQANISLSKLTSGNLREDEIVQMKVKGINPLGETPIFIDDSGALNSFELRSKVRRMVNKHKVGLVIIDYLQLMHASGDKNTYNREQEISKISRDLKGLAKDLKIPIIALSQLNRMIETRKDNKIPQLSDLRESGAIEQDADLVMFLYRPEMYDQTTDEGGESLKGATFLKIAKHRNGTLTDGAGIRFHFESSIQRFEEDHTDEGWSPPPYMQGGGNGGHNAPPQGEIYVHNTRNYTIRRSSAHNKE